MSWLSKEGNCLYRITENTAMTRVEKRALPTGQIPQAGYCSISDPRFQLCTHPMALTEDCPEAKTDWCGKSWAR